MHFSTSPRNYMNACATTWLFKNGQIHINALSESWSNTRFFHCFKTKRKVIYKENLPVNQMSTRAFSQKPLNLPYNRTTLTSTSALQAQYVLSLMEKPTLKHNFPYLLDLGCHSIAKNTENPA